MATINWDEVTAVSTAGAAVFTAVMAWFTRKAIKEGQGQRQEANDHYGKTQGQDKQHHEDTFRPLLVLSPNSDVDAGDRQAFVGAHAFFDLLIVDCVVRNIGTGPALNVRLSARGDGRTGFGPTRELTPMAAGDVFKDPDGHINIKTIFTDEFNSQDFKGLPNGLWLLVLEYNDVFGNSFHTIHTKQRDMPWTRVGRGSTPDTTPPSTDALLLTAPVAFKDSGNAPGLLM